MPRLDAAGIPSVVKSADHYGTIYEQQSLALRSGVPHVGIFRFSTHGQNDGFNYDVPGLDGLDYGGLPSQAAARHWNRYMAKLPPEFIDTTWLEFFNEVDKGRSDYLGYVALETARLAVAAGMRSCYFGFSAGEPEREHWQTKGMLAFLDFAGRHKDLVAVSLHEYSYNAASLEDSQPHPFPYQIGRVEQLLGVCDDAGLPHPTVFVTEFGWTHTEVPAPEVALPQLGWAQSVYARWPDVKAVAVWYLGMGFENIATKAVRLIPGVTQLALNYKPSEPGNGDDEPPPENDRDYTVVVNLVPQNVTDAEYARVRNATKLNRESMVQSAHDALHLVKGARANSVVKVWWPQRWTGGDIAIWLKDRGASNVELYETIAPPPPPAPSAPALLGLHARSDGGDLPEAELAEFREARAGVIKILHMTSERSVARLAAEHPGVPFIIRPYVDFRGGRVVTPCQFWDWTADQLQEVVRAIGPREVWIEVHNEPNLRLEGLFSSWHSPADFARWFMGVVPLIRQHIPQARVLFPGLSPGHPYADRWKAHDFAAACDSAIQAVDGVAVHAYWNSVMPEYPLETAVAEVEWFARRYSHKPIWVTEASNNKEDTPGNKATQYVEFAKRLGWFPNVKGVTYFIASASDPAFANEVWVGRGIGHLVGN
jgi:hypothetical protein